jgi:phosphoglycerate dehydrogenase-like enzyme
VSTRKLLVWDRAWAPYASEFAARLGEAWQVRASADGVAWLLRELPGATALVAIELPPEARPAAAALELFLFPGAGLLQTDPNCLPAGCRVVNVFEHEIPIAEYALLMMLAHATRLIEHLRSFQQGRWDGSGRVGGVPHSELAGKVLGIIGYGRIGRAVAMRAQAFGMRLLPFDGAGGLDALHTVLRHSNFLVIAAPLTPQSRGMLGRAELELLPPGAFLINVSRAEIVEEQALFNALQSGRLGGAALDVWYRYPQTGEPGFGSNLPFHELPNAYCTPHYSAWTKEMILRRIDKMCDNLRRLSEGQPLERVVMVGSWRP